jgi:regulator of protease activity HflC (stomatin/prohibitin superfamily)
VVRYLVGVDLQELMSSGRFRTGEELRQRIQSAADALQLGAKILFVGLQDVHPPVKIAGAYEAVVGARQKKEATILNAKAYSAETNELSRAAATVRVNEAEAARNRIESAALARAALFTNQIPAFVASPQIYSARAYLQALIRGGAQTRKIIMAATNTADVIILDLQDKIRPDLLDIPLPKAK